MADNKVNQQQVQDVSISFDPDVTPVLYTDNVVMSTNEDGLVLNVGQSVGPTNQLRIVARIGMSRVHAKKFLKELGSLLALTDGQSQTGEKKN